MVNTGGRSQTGHFARRSITRSRQITASESNNSVKPFLKWAGGKRWLVPQLLPLVGSPEGTYFEPFLGAGALFLSIDRDIKKVGSDANLELAEAWQTIRDNLEDVLETLRGFENSREFYNKVRAWDRSPTGLGGYSPAERTARLIFLNKTCFNGLYRVNSKGQFNVPFGNYRNPLLVDIETLESVRDFLNYSKGPGGRRAEVRQADYKAVLETAKAGDVVYFDPPYEPLTTTSSFVGYQGGGFSRTDQTSLRDLAAELGTRGVKVIISNSSASFVRDIYDPSLGFRIREVSSNRAISASQKGRKPVNELLITCGPL